MERDVNISLLTSEISKSKFKNRLSNVNLNSVEVFFFDRRKLIYKFSNKLKLTRKLYIWFELREKVKEISFQKKIDKIYIQTVDDYFFSLLIIGNPFNRIPFSFLYLHPKVHISDAEKIDNLKNVIFKHFFKRLVYFENLHYILSLDSDFISYCNSKFYLNKQKFLYLTDFCINKKFTQNDTTNVTYNLPKNKKILLVYGSIEERKGIRELFDTMTNENWPDELFVVIGGRWKKSCKYLLTTNLVKSLLEKNKLFIVNKFLPENDVHTLFSLTDYVWVAYNKVFRGSSGVLLQASLYKKPSIGNCYGIIKTEIKNYNLGVIVDIDSSKSIIKGLSNLLNKNVAIKNENFARHIKDNSFDIHFKTIYSSLQ